MKIIIIIKDQKDNSRLGVIEAFSVKKKIFIYLPRSPFLEENIHYYYQKKKKKVP